MRFSVVSAVGIALASGLVAGLPTSSESRSVDAVDTGLATRSGGLADSRPSELEARQCRHYTIRAGDTWISIANHFGVTVAALRKANPNVNPNTLSPGQVINLPC